MFDPRRIIIGLGTALALAAPSMTHAERKAERSPTVAQPVLSEPTAECRPPLRCDGPVATATCRPPLRCDDQRAGTAQAGETSGPRPKRGT
jgi:hypothetical protein